MEPPLRTPGQAISEMESIIWKYVYRPGKAIIGLQSILITRKIEFKMREKQIISPKSEYQQNIAAGVSSACDNTKGCKSLEKKNNIKIEKCLAIRLRVSSAALFSLFFFFLLAMHVAFEWATRTIRKNGKRTCKYSFIIIMGLFADAIVGSFVNLCNVRIKN